MGAEIEMDHIYFYDYDVFIMQRFLDVVVLNVSRYTKSL